MDSKYFKSISIYSVISIELIMFTRLLGGLFYNVSSSTLVKLIARAYCVLCVYIFGRTFFTLLLYYVGPGVFITIILMVVQYLCNVLINFIYDGEYFMNFLKKIRKIDYLLHNRPINEIQYTRVLFMVAMCDKAFGIFGQCYSYPMHCRSNFIFMFTTALLPLVISLSNFTRIMMFESLYHRMKLLRKRFERDLSVARRFEDGENVMVQNLQKCMIIYNMLLNTVRETNPPMKILVFVAVTFVVPKYLILAFETLSSKSFQNTKFTIIQQVCESFVPFIPGVFVELVNSEVDEIRLCVVKQLLVYRGMNARDAIKDAVKYFENRPFKYTVLRVLTIDLTLVLTLFGIITTYTVAMIQFAHFYD